MSNRQSLPPGFSFSQSRRVVLLLLLTDPEAFRIMTSPHSRTTATAPLLSQQHDGISPRRVFEVSELCFHHYVLFPRTTKRVRSRPPDLLFLLFIAAQYRVSVAYVVVESKRPTCNTRSSAFLIYLKLLCISADRSLRLYARDQLK